MRLFWAGEMEIHVGLYLYVSEQYRFDQNRRRRAGYHGADVAQWDGRDWHHLPRPVQHGPYPRYVAHDGHDERWRRNQSRLRFMQYPEPGQYRVFGYHECSGAGRRWV